VSNPLKYVTSTPTGALRHANLGVGVASIQYDETFTSGLNPSNLTTYYLVYEPVNGASTRIYAPANSTELIQLAKSKGSTETTESGALTWLSDNGYYPANRVLDNVVTDGLKFLVDSTTLISFPGSGDNWLDLSGEAEDGVINNGPVFDEDSRALDFDGVDDYVEIDSTIGLGNPCTVIVVANVESSGNYTMFAPNSNGVDNWLGTNGTQLELFATQTADTNNFVLRGSGLAIGNFQQLACTIDGDTAKVWINGEEKNSTTRTFTIGGWSSTGAIGRRGVISQRYFPGKIASVIGYNKALTQAEINQNYYQGPIVTDNLKFSLDASNLISFEPGTTAAFSLTGSSGAAAGDGVLTNGVGFSNSSNGAWDFDGVDDYILYSSTQDVGTVFTVNFWIKPNGKARQSIVANGYPYQTNKGFFIACPGNTTNSDSFFLSLGADDNYATAANGSLTQGVWQMVTCRVNGPGNLMKLYVNGTETNYSHQDNGNTTLQYDTGDFLTGRRTLASSDFLESPVSCIQMYNRALTEEEIQQNYNANVKKFT